METECALNVFVSFNGDRFCQARSSHHVSPTFSPHSVGWPFRSSKFPSLVERWRVTTWRYSYERWCGDEMTFVVKTNMLFDGDASSIIGSSLQFVQNWTSLLVYVVFFAPGVLSLLVLSPLYFGHVVVICEWPQTL